MAPPESTPPLQHTASINPSASPAAHPSLAGSAGWRAPAQAQAGTGGVRSEHSSPAQRLLTSAVLHFLPSASPAPPYLIGDEQQHMLATKRWARTWQGAAAAGESESEREGGHTSASAASCAKAVTHYHTAQGLASWSPVCLAKPNANTQCM
jgi:hypothetical protein